MKYIFQIFFLSLICTACGPSTVLDRPFNPATYLDDLLFMYQKNQVSQSDLYTLVYTIVKQREYYNYSLEGKTFREILETGRKLRREGLALEELFVQNGAQDVIQVKIENEGTGFIRNAADKSRLEKKLKFNCVFTNTSDRDVVLLTNTFQFFGPFDDYLGSMGYQLNCLLPAGQSKRVNYLANAKTIRDNLLFQGTFPETYLSVDSLLNEMKITLGGSSFTNDTRYHDKCNFQDSRVDPLNEFKFKEDFDPKAMIEKDPTGKTLRINYGNAHLQIGDPDKVIRMK